MTGLKPTQAYIANRNRTLQHLYEEEIGNNIFLAGDSHQNCKTRAASTHSHIHTDTNSLDRGVRPCLARN